MKFDKVYIIGFLVWKTKSGQCWRREFREEMVQMGWMDIILKEMGVRSVRY